MKNSEIFAEIFSTEHHCEFDDMNGYDLSNLARHLMMAQRFHDHPGMTDLIFCLWKAVQNVERIPG